MKTLTNTLTLHQGDPLKSVYFVFEKNNKIKIITLTFRFFSGLHEHVFSKSTITFQNKTGFCC